MKANSLMLAIIIAIITVILAGCGGGGGGGGNGSTAPTAMFTVTPANGSMNTVFAFDASGCFDNEDQPSSLQVRWDWDNDGVWDTIYSTIKTATHVYNVAGTYVVKLQVMDTEANVASMTSTIIVDAASPTAAFTVNPVAGDTSTVFGFDASGCTDPQDAPAALQVRWDWENDGTWDTAYSNTKTATHTYATGGTYTVKLVVKDTDGHAGTVTHQVTVNSAPTPAFTITPTTGGVGTAFAFDASGCTDLQDPPSALQVRWDWTNDGTWDTAYSTTKTANHTINDAGTVTVRMEVKDTGGMTASTTRPIVLTMPPTAVINVTPLSGNTGTSFIFHGALSTDNEDPLSALQMRWDFNNDGIWETNFRKFNMIGYTFSTPGSHTVVMQVKDTDGLTDTELCSVTVVELPAPNAIRHFSTLTYTAGMPFIVSILVTSADSTLAHAIEDIPPVGWVVSNISHAGVYDAVNKKVKWGPFFDNNARTLTYTVTPPIGVPYGAFFDGTVSFDGTNDYIRGNIDIFRE